MMTAKISQTLNTIIMILFVLVVLTTKTVFAGNQTRTDSDGGTTYGNSWITVSSGNDIGGASTHRVPYAWLQSIVVKTYTTCGGYFHQISGNQATASYNIASTQALAGSTSSCIDSTTWWNYVDADHETMKESGIMTYAKFSTAASVNRSR